MVGSEVVIRTNNYSLVREFITSQSGGTINWNSSIPLSNGMPFFVQNSILTLDRQNEWYYNPTTKKIDIYSTSEPTNVFVSSIDSLVSFGYNSYNQSNASYITIQNLNLTGANSYAIWGYQHLMSGNHLVGVLIQQCNISFTGICSVSIEADNLTFINNIIDNSNGSGLVFDYSTNLTVENNLLRSIGINKGMTQTNGWESAMSIAGTSNALIMYNTITKVGYDGINFSGTGTVKANIQNNFIDTFCTVLNDGGGIYGNVNAKISGNIILNGALGQIILGIYDPWAVGVYLDDGSINDTVFSNTIYNCNRVGIYLHNSVSCVINNNLCFNNPFWQIYTVDDQGPGTLQKNSIINNQFISGLNNWQTASYYWSGSAATTTILSNNCYSRPSANNGEEITTNNNSQNLTINQWQTLSGQDKGSYKSFESTKSDSDIEFIYNNSKIAKIFTLSQPMLDVKGNLYVDSIVLQPFTSLVLMKDYNPPKYSKVSKSICNGNNYNGWTTTGTYDQTYTTASGADSTVITYLTVNPTYNIQLNKTIITGQNYLSWTTTGIYTINLFTTLGCDSNIITNLVVLPPLSSTQNKSICNGSNYNGWTTSGTYTQNLVNASGADSIVTTYLKVNPIYNITLNKSIIEGQNYDGWTSSGNYILNLNTQAGCDSTVIISLTVLPPISTNQNKSICNGSNYNGWTTSGTYKQNLVNGAGADSIVTTYLTVFPIYNINISDTIITGQKYDGFGTTGNYIVNLNTINGCDSIVNLHLFVWPPKTLTHYIGICEGNSYNGWTQGGIYTQTIPTINGADSIVTTYLTVNPVFNINDTINIPPGQSYKGWTTSGNYVFNLTTIAGCDSIVHINLLVSIIDPYNSNINNLNSDLGILVYPNPTKGDFIVRYQSLPEPGSIIKVYDINGKLLESRNIKNLDEEFDFGGKNPGLYLIKSIIGSRENINKLVIQN